MADLRIHDTDAGALRRCTVEDIRARLREWMAERWHRRWLTARRIGRNRDRVPLARRSTRAE